MRRGVFALRYYAVTSQQELTIHPKHIEYNVY